MMLFKGKIENIFPYMSKRPLFKCIASKKYAIMLDQGRARFTEKNCNGWTITIQSLFLTFGKH